MENTNYERFKQYNLPKELEFRKTSQIDNSEKDLCQPSCGSFVNGAKQNQDTFVALRDPLEMLCIGGWFCYLISIINRFKILYR